jgi:hypothetical protein
LFVRRVFAIADYSTLGATRIVTKHNLLGGDVCLLDCIIASAGGPRPAVLGKRQHLASESVGRPVDRLADRAKRRNLRLSSIPCRWTNSKDWSSGS